MNHVYTMYAVRRLILGGVGPVRLPASYKALGYDCSPSMTQLLSYIIKP